ncbi:unnamed protein product [Paramecium octaurelia]|uniref:Uncharacterized protein n=1 Tax=Paramecium octaurelia TaxID=43137 RepID=A0A8S1YMB0_PAROT|nr:unnamed protein product [Paramecium octaurelia]
MGQSGYQLKKCQQEDHNEQIETICYNQQCTDFRLNCSKCEERFHQDHYNDVLRINSLVGFIKDKNTECQNLISDLKTFVEIMNQSFSQLISGI